MRLSLLGLALAMALTACEGSTANFFKGTPTFFPTAQQNYERGLKELKSSSWLAAIQFFQHVRTNFGFSKWATLAELGIADANLGRDKFTEAIDGYKQFIKSHPGNERVQDGYAAFKIGEAYHKQIPSDWFLTPPSYEKDQGPVIDAMRELNNFVDQYGDSPYLPKARTYIADCVRRLTDHELYVASFYLKRNKPYAAAGRLEGILKDYPGAQREPETLLLLGKVYLKMDKPDKAREVFGKLAAEHPGDSRAAKAKGYLQDLERGKPHG